MHIDRPDKSENIDFPLERPQNYHLPVFSSSYLAPAMCSILGAVKRFQSSDLFVFSTQRGCFLAAAATPNKHGCYVS